MITKLVVCLAVSHRLLEVKMAFISKMGTSMVAMSAVMGPIVFGERPATNDEVLATNNEFNEADAHDEVNAPSSRMATVCCLQSSKGRMKNFAEFEYPNNKETAFMYRFYGEQNKIRAVLPEDPPDGKDLAACDMTALLDFKKVQLSNVHDQAREACTIKMQELPAYWEKCEEWEEENREVLKQDVDAHLLYTKEQQIATLTQSNEKHINEYRSASEQLQGKVQELIQKKEELYIAPLTSMIEKLETMKQDITTRLQTVSSNLKAELKKTADIVESSGGKRLLDLDKMRDEIKPDSDKPDSDPPVVDSFPQFPHQAIAQVDRLGADSFAAIKEQAKYLKERFLSDFQFEEIINGEGGVDAVQTQITGETNNLLQDQDKAMTAEEEKLEREKVKWVKSVNQAQDLYKKGAEKKTDVSAQIEPAKEKVQKMIANDAEPRTSDRPSVCPRGAGKSNHCCCLMMPQGSEVSNAQWGWVPENFGDWTSCAATKQMSTGMENDAMRVFTAGTTDTGHCKNFARCSGCEQVGADGKMIMGVKGQQLKLHQDAFGQELEKYGYDVKTLKPATDGQHFYVNCGAAKVKISTNAAECESEICREESAFVVANSCCAKGKTCASNSFAIFSGKSSYCQFKATLDCCSKGGC